MLCILYTHLWTTIPLLIRSPIRDQGQASSLQFFLYNIQDCYSLLFDAQINWLKITIYFTLFKLGKSPRNCDTTFPDVIPSLLEDKLEAKKQKVLQAMKFLQVTLLQCLQWWKFRSVSCYAFNYILPNITPRNTGIIRRNKINGEKNEMTSHWTNCITNSEHTDLRNTLAILLCDRLW